MPTVTLLTLALDPSGEQVGVRYTLDGKLPVFGFDVPYADVTEDLLRERQQALQTKVDTLDALQRALAPRITGVTGPVLVQ